MKLQYAGDRRDFYKYDLLLALGRSLHLAGGLTVIPMLTPDDPTRNEGALRSYVAGRRDAELHAFVRTLAPREPDSLDRVAAFFSQRGIPTKFVPEGFLLPARRDDYFAAVRDEDLTDSIVFLDPDIGLEMQSSAAKDTRHLRYEELRAVYRRMSSSSVLVAYQHMPRRPHPEVYQKLTMHLFKCSGISHAYLLDMGDVGFIVSPRSTDRVPALAEVLGKRFAQMGVRLVGMGATHMIGT